MSKSKTFINGCLIGFDEYILLKYCGYCVRQINGLDLYHWSEDQFLKSKHERKCVRRIDDERRSS